MKSYQIFAGGIPRGKRIDLARILGLSEDLIGMWCREPLSGENQTGTGSLNPIDRLDVFFDFCLLHSPATAQLIAARYSQKLDAFYSRFQRAPINWRVSLRQLIKETSEAIQAAAVDAPVDELERECAEAIDALRRIINVRREMDACERVGRRQ